MLLQVDVFTKDIILLQILVIYLIEHEIITDKIVDETCDHISVVLVGLFWGLLLYKYDTMPFSACHL